MSTEQSYYSLGRFIPFIYLSSFLHDPFPQYFSFRREFVRPDMVMRTAKCTSEEEIELLQTSLAVNFDFAEYLSLLLGEMLGSMVQVRVEREIKVFVILLYTHKSRMGVMER